eukprot:CAMPEP_0184752234 /NCGR_PEP_ID=MMETSP0315-20130426/43472_1 /TAXON_ID=101924 /ORGANISM="Rhodosorus marinus, Strain UTEX LB 2760" /LENGTH=51 /DNA_ID=CAMNT_0027231553 /DNA_START=622 /DNA_END=777 /DNA_ORIENTATION=+
MDATSPDASLAKGGGNGRPGYGSGGDVEVGETNEADFVSTRFWRTVYDEIM